MAAIQKVSRSVRSLWAHSITKWGSVHAIPGTRPTALRAVLLAVLLTGSFLHRGDSLLGQPAQAPQLNTPQFQSTDIDPAFQFAAIAEDEQTWESIVRQVKGILRAQWEFQVDQNIAANVAAVAETDTFVGNVAYKDYIASELLIQKGQALEAWDQNIEAAIQTERVAFLASLESTGMQGAEQASQAAVSDANDISSSASVADEYAKAARELEARQLEYRWRLEHQITQALEDYDTAADQLDADRDAYLAALQQSEAEFQQNLDAIKTYEAQVRAGLSSTTDSLEQYLNESGLFFVEVCDDATNECEFDEDQLTPAGITLQSLIQDIRDGLQNDQPLSVLAQQLTTYLQERESEARQNRDTWEDAIEEPGVWPGTSAHASVAVNWQDWVRFIPDANHVQGGMDTIKFSIDTNSAFELVRDLIAFREGTDTTSFSTFLRAGDRREVRNVRNVDVCGSSSSYQAAASQTAYDLNGGCYSNSGYAFGFYRFHAVIFGFGFAAVGASFEEESEYHLRADFDFYDAAAESNRDTWQGFVNDLGPMISTWTDTILPALTNWETQTAQYEANYASWQADSQQQLTAYEQFYQNGQAQIAADRDAYINRLRNEIGRTDAEFQALARAIQNRSASAAELQTALTELPTGASTRGNARESLAAIARSRPTLDLSHFERSQEGVPDFAALSEANETFQKTLRGALNIAVVENQNDEAHRQQARATEMLADMLRQAGAITEAQLDAAVAAQRAKYDDRVARTPWLSCTF